MSKNLTNAELNELLRYFIGDPVPYTQDARFRDLVEQFKATDERKNEHTDDPRVSPASAEPAEVETTTKAK